MDDYLKGQSHAMYAEALGYLKTLENKLNKKSKFNNELLYHIVTLCTEKLFMTILMHHNLNATHHTPLALFKEADKIHKLPLSFKETAILIGKYESICLVDAFGYKIPDEDELLKMINGLVKISAYVNDIVHSKTSEAIY
jgi:hypothetical protein